MTKRTLHRQSQTAQHPTNSLTKLFSKRNQDGMSLISDSRIWVSNGIHLANISLLPQQTVARERVTAKTPLT